MFKVNEDLSIYLTRGDAIAFSIGADANGYPYKFNDGDEIEIKVFEKNDVDKVVLQKTFPAVAGEEVVHINLTGDETKFGEYISKPKDYWYEIVLNPKTNPQTIVCYDEDGAKVLRLFPEGGEME